jgi:sugar phosphate isomerase/epimerase
MTEFHGFSFSTSWNWRSGSGERVVEEILELGFDEVELNYRITDRMLEAIAPYVERGAISVSSVHNVFPAVEDPRFDTDSRMLGWRDDELRGRAIELAIGSVEAGRELGARAVVIHPGVMPWDESPPGPGGLSGIALDEELKRLWREEGPGSPAYRAAFAEFTEYRERGMRGELERILASLEAIAEYVARRGIPIAIGLENRPMAFQVPDFAEMRYFLEALEGSAVGMWLDVGHGAVLRNMGFFDDRVEAPRLADRLVGMHIHDVDGVDDHFAPYSKEGLDPYLGLIRRSPIKVLELGAKNGRDGIVAGARRLKAALAAEEDGK